MQFECPFPIQDYPHVLLAHGGGGQLMHMLLEKMFFPALGNPWLEQGHDAAALTHHGARWALTTDAFVVHPWEFPGGNIGSLAVHGTINDLAAAGAQPVALAAAFILEEGLPMEDLWRIVDAMRQAATQAGVPIVTGDTKVVERGKGDGVFITTTGLGLIPPGIEIHPRRARPGDVILINGAIGVHGIAIMAAREGFEFDEPLESDTAALHTLVARVLEVGGSAVHVLRDPTRGGVASALNEIARAAQVGIQLEETALPLWPQVQGACELLGLDPLYVANEGKMLVIVEPSKAEAVLQALRAHPLGQEAARIGQVVAEHPGQVVLHTRIGGRQIVPMLSGEQLPRIC